MTHTYIPKQSDTQIIALAEIRRQNPRAKPGLADMVKDMTPVVGEKRIAKECRENNFSLAGKVATQAATMAVRYSGLAAIGYTGYRILQYIF